MKAKKVLGNLIAIVLLTLVAAGSFGAYMLLTLYEPDVEFGFAANDETKQRFWDDVPCVICNVSYDIAVRECSFDDIDEIDSYEELCEIDPSYRDWS